MVFIIQKNDSDDHENTDTSEENNTQNNNQDKNQSNARIDITPEELRERTGCYVTITRDDYLNYFQSKNQVFGDIDCKQVENTPNVFRITTIAQISSYIKERQDSCRPKL